MFLIKTVGLIKVILISKLVLYVFLQGGSKHMDGIVYYIFFIIKNLGIFCIENIRRQYAKI